MLQSQELIASNQIIIKINRKYREKRTSPSPEQLITNIIQELQNMMKEYMEKLGAIFNSLAMLVIRIT